MKYNNFDTDREDFEEYELSPLGICDNDSNEVHLRGEFELEYFTELKIVQAISHPPGGSGFSWNGVESDYNDTRASIYYEFKYNYNSERKTHLEYLKKLEKLFDSSGWQRRCEKEFDKEFQKYKDFIKEYPGYDYQDELDSRMRKKTVRKKKH